MVRYHFESYERPRGSLPWSVRLYYGFGHFFNDLTASVWFSYLIVYLNNVLHFSDTLAGLVLMIGQIVDAFLTPLIGIEADVFIAQTNLAIKYGKRKILYLFGTICVLFAFPFIFIPCPGCLHASEKALLVLILPLVLIFQFGWASVQISHLAILPQLTNVETERDLLNIIRNIVDVIADIIVYGLAWMIFDLNISENFKANWEFSSLAVIITVIGTLSSILFHFRVDENLNYGNIFNETTYLFGKSAPKSPVFWLKNAKFYMVGSLYTLSKLYQNLSSVFIPLYIYDSLKLSERFIAIVPLIMNISGFLISCFLQMIITLFGKQLTHGIGLLTAMSACYLIEYGKNAVYIYHISVLMGCSISIMICCSTAMISDVIGRHADTGGFVYGSMTFADKLSSGLIVFIIQYFHSIYCVDCNWYYREIMSYGLAVILMISAFILSLIHVIFKTSNGNSNNSNEYRRYTH